MSWLDGWMNYWMICPKGHGISKGYMSYELTFEEKCMDCGMELEGFRVLKKEDA